LSEVTYTVATPSTDHKAMQSYWEQVDAILSGGDAVRAKGEKLLPRLPAESKLNYDYRLKTAKFTNVFADIVDNLASKPFSQLVKVDKIPSEMNAYVEDVDGKGSHAHTFFNSVFAEGLAYGLSWVFVDYNQSDRQLSSRQDDLQAGARPYLIQVSPLDMIAVETAKINGKIGFTHCRFRSNYVQREPGTFKEELIERIYEYNREQITTIVDNVVTNTGIWANPTYKVWTRKADRNGEGGWVSTEPKPMTIDRIPLVPYLTASTKGNGFTFNPLLKNAADLQINLYGKESLMDNADLNSAFPMIAGNGVNPPVDPNDPTKALPIQTGAGAALYAPMSVDGKHGAWEILEPGGSTLTHLAKQVETITQQLRELGRQPLTAQTGNLTVITTAFAAQKANSAIKAAGLLLKDAMENTFKLMGLWKNRNIEPAVNLFLDFDAEISGSEYFEDILKMYDQGLISRETVIEQAIRFNRLPDGFNPEGDLKAQLSEIPGDEEDEADDSPAADADADAA